MFNRLSDRDPCRGAKAYAPCAFIVYPHTLCRAFGGAYAIRPYPAGRKIGFEGLVGNCVWDKGRFFDKENEKRKDFLAGG